MGKWPRKTRLERVGVAQGTPRAMTLLLKVNDECISSVSWLAADRKFNASAYCLTEIDHGWPGEQKPARTYATSVEISPA